MPAISFKATDEERALVTASVKRAQALGFTRDPMDLEMDILAAHANGCSLDFAKLMSFDAFNFIHDVGGIVEHLDRVTGKLGGFFLPRCART